MALLYPPIIPDGLEQTTFKDGYVPPGRFCFSHLHGAAIGFGDIVELMENQPFLGPHC